jgi:hypothetical protein
MEIIRGCLQKEEIDIIGMDDMIREILEYFDGKTHVKIQHQSLRFLQILLAKGLINIPLSD